MVFGSAFDVGLPPRFKWYAIGLNDELIDEVIELMDDSGEVERLLLLLLLFVLLLLLLLLLLLECVLAALAC